MEQEKVAVQTVDVPALVRVHCPLVQFKLREVKLCIGCPHFRGLADRFPEGDKKFTERFSVSCAGLPTQRQLVELEA